MITFSDTTFKLAELVVSTSLKKEIKIAGAESCTGGLISAAITAIPGSSKVFEFCVASYSNLAKNLILDVSPEIISKYGAVSSEVAIEMAKGVNKIYQSDIVFAVTGIAGPEGGSKVKPVGTVFIAISNDIKKPNKINVFDEHFDGNRAAVRIKTVDFVLEKILIYLS